MNFPARLGITTGVLAVFGGAIVFLSSGAPGIEDAWIKSYVVRGTWQATRSSPRKRREPSPR